MPFIYIPKEIIGYLFYVPNVLAMLVFTGNYVFILANNKNHFNQLVDYDHINKSLLVYFLLLFISLFFSENILLSIFGMPLRLEAFLSLSMYMLFFLAARNSNILNSNFFKGILTTGSAVSLYGIIQYYGFDPLHLKNLWKERTLPWVIPIFWVVIWFC